MEKTIADVKKTADPTEGGRREVELDNLKSEVNRLRDWRHDVDTDRRALKAWRLEQQEKER